MALKTFNIDHEVYKKFSDHCKKEGLSMSKKVENFIRKELEALEKQLSPPSKTEEKEHPMHKYC